MPKNRKDQFKPSDRQRTGEMLCYPGNYDNTDIWQSVSKKTHQAGASQQYPPDFAAALGHCGAILRSKVLMARTLNHDYELYRVCADAYTAFTGRAVPLNPPNVEQISEPARRLAQDDDALNELLRRMPYSMAEQARLHGNLAQGRRPEWAHPDHRHLIFGDGVIHDRYSDIRPVRDPESNDEVLHGSQAGDPKHARVQRRTRTSGKDGKKDPGVNNMALYTWTDDGVVALAVNQAFGAERWTLMPLIDRVVEAAGDSIHTLAYDRVVMPGKLQSDLMARLRLNVVNKPIARSLPKGAPSAAASYAGEAVAQAWRPGTGRLNEPQREILTTRLAERRYNEGHLPAGVSIYKKTQGFEIVDSQFRKFTEEHTGAGDGHRDRFILDDETLYLADPDDPSCKGRYCPPLDSFPEPTPWGTWARRTRWHVPCEAGDWILERLWTPGLPPGVLDPRQRREQKLIALMDPVPRCAETFAAATRRSTAESMNNFVENTLPHYGRAAQVDVNLQKVAYYGANLVLNAITWQRHPDSRKPWGYNFDRPEAA